MALERGDIVEVYFELPYSKETKTHPAIIISNEDVHDEEIYICVMMTTSMQNDIFSFPITNEMLNKPSDKFFSQARCHIISYVMEKHILKNSKNFALKANAVDRLVARIAEVSLSS
jgi:mRNA-degrading endonuclease toxin of MazEF toxin-antitoxin module